MADTGKTPKIFLIGNPDETRNRVESELRQRGYQVAVAQRDVTHVRHLEAVVEEVRHFQPDAVVATHMDALAFQYPAKEEGRVQLFNPNMMLCSASQRGPGNHLHPVGLINELRRPENGGEKLPIIAFGPLSQGIRMCLGDNQVAPVRYTGKESDGFGKLDKAIQDTLTPRFGRVPY